MFKQLLAFHFIKCYHCNYFQCLMIDAKFPKVILTILICGISLRFLESITYDLTS